MGSVITVRVDLETVRILERVARRRKQTRSQVVREAIAALAEKDPPAGPTPYEAIAHLVGIVKEGPPHLSERTGEKLKRLLRDRERRRR
jgi:hypothetical protein